MPGKHSESRKTDRSVRYWFPQSFFGPTLIESEVSAVAANHPTLNAIADHIETITAEVGIPVTIRGGIVSAAKRSIGFAIDIDPSHRQHLDAHRQLIRRLKAAYHCEQAGVDENEDLLWLFRIDPAHQNTFAIMMAEGGQDETNH